MKRLLLALLLVCCSVPAFAAGQWPQARSQQIADNGRPAVGYRAYFFESGTSTPLTTYTDYSLAVPNPAYVESDGRGRFPAVFFDEDDGFYRVRVTTAAGVVIYDDDAMPIVGPGEGGGGAEVPVDPDALLKVGDTKTRYGTGVIAGFVRLNGRTIGSATSGAAERANADTQDLYEYLWLTDSTLTVSGGRGVSGTADFEANKTITLPDFRGRALVALDDMGNSAAGNLTGFTTLGEVMGGQNATLLAGQIPVITGTAAILAHRHFGFANVGAGTTAGATASTQVPFSRDFTSSNDYTAGTTSTAATVGRTSEAAAYSADVSAGDASPDTVSLVQPSVGITVYIKL